MPPTRPLPSFSLHRRHSLIKDPHFGPWGSPIGQTRQSTEFYRVFFYPSHENRWPLELARKRGHFFRSIGPSSASDCDQSDDSRSGRHTRTHTHTRTGSETLICIHRMQMRAAGLAFFFFWRVPPSRLRWHYRRPLKSSRISGNYRGFFFTEFSRESRNSLGVSPRSFFFIVSSSLESFLTLRLRLLRCDLLR